MQNQTITQTLNIVVGNTPAGGGLADTGSSSSAKLLPVIAIILITVSLLTWYLTSRRMRLTRYKLNPRNLGIFLALSLAIVGLITSSRLAQAAPTLTLGSNQNNINITIPQGGGTATNTSTLTSGTASSDGYKLTAQLTASEPGIAIKLKGGAVTTSTLLTPNATPLELKTTTTNTTNDQTEVTLDFVIDGTVTSGTKELKLNYQITDNEPSTPPAPTTMQSMTSTYCNSMTVYNGTNDEAIINLTDTRGGITQTYQVAKLADNNCWMLNNLKLGSTSATTLLTPKTQI